MVVDGSASALCEDDALKIGRKEYRCNKWSGGNNLLRTSALAREKKGDRVTNDGHALQLDYRKGAREDGLLECRLPVCIEKLQPCPER